MPFVISFVSDAWPSALVYAVRIVNPGFGAGVAGFADAGSAGFAAGFGFGFCVAGGGVFGFCA